VTSVGDKAVVYQDSVTALKELSVARELGLPLGIENDQLTGGKRALFHEGGKTVFDWQHPQPPVAIPGNWANVDERLGAVMVEGAGMAYVQASGYHPQTAVCSDMLCVSFSDRPRRFKPGEEVAHRTVLLFVEITARKTAALAKSFSVKETMNGRT